MARKISKALLATFLSLSAFASNNHAGAMIESETINQEENNKKQNEFAMKQIFGDYSTMMTGGPIMMPLPKQSNIKRDAIVGLTALFVGGILGILIGRATKKVPSGRNQELNLNKKK